MRTMIRYIVLNWKNGLEEKAITHYPHQLEVGSILESLQLIERLQGIGKGYGTIREMSVELKGEPD